MHPVGPAVQKGVGGGMNRQQRRALAKRREVENKYYDELVERQNMINDYQLEMNLICFALAMRESYGFGQQRIAKGMRAFNSQLMRFLDGTTVEDLRDELREKTGIFLTLTTDRNVVLRYGA